MSHSLRLDDDSHLRLTSTSIITDSEQRKHACDLISRSTTTILKNHSQWLNGKSGSGPSPTLGALSTSSSASSFKIRKERLQNEMPSLQRRTSLDSKVLWKLRHHYNIAATPGLFKPTLKPIC
jgi:ABC-type lipoprotein export system ATPase subunit